jgi:hypothetical protein
LEGRKNACGDNNKNNTVGHFQQMAMVWKGLIDAVHKGTPKYNLYWWSNRVERLASSCNPKASRVMAHKAVEGFCCLQDVTRNRKPE